MSGDRAAAACYSLDRMGVLSTLRTTLTIANTIASSPDGTRMDLADTAMGELAASHHDPATGKLGDRDTGFAPPRELPGVPDGSAVDVEGCLWNARRDGGCIVRLGPDGSVDRIQDLPVSKSKSCAFVGRTLHVITSNWDFDDTVRAREPQAGSLLAIDVGIAGVPRAPFAGLPP